MTIPGTLETSLKGCCKVEDVWEHTSVIHEVAKLQDAIPERTGGMFLCYIV
jgi:hypothetical protein